MCVSGINNTSETVGVILVHHMAVTEDTILTTGAQIRGQRSGIEAPPLQPGTAHHEIDMTPTQMTDIPVKQIPHLIKTHSSLGVCMCVLGGVLCLQSVCEKFVVYSLFPVNVVLRQSAHTHTHSVYEALHE